MIASQWIPVSERVPDTREWVLVVTEGQSTDEPPRIARYYGAEDGWHVDSYYRVSHWMPLPKPPWGYLAESDEDQSFRQLLEHYGFLRAIQERHEIGRLIGFETSTEARLEVLNDLHAVRDKIIARAVQKPDGAA